MKLSAELIGTKVCGWIYASERARTFNWQIYDANGASKQTNKQAQRRRVPSQYEIYSVRYSIQYFAWPLRGCQAAQKEINMRRGVASQWTQVSILTALESDSWLAPMCEGRISPGIPAHALWSAQFFARRVIELFSVNGTALQQRVSSGTQIQFHLHSSSVNFITGLDGKQIYRLPKMSEVHGAKWKSSFG